MKSFKLLILLKTLFNFWSNSGHFHLFGIIIISIIIVTAVVKMLQTAFLGFSPVYKQDEGDQIKYYSTTLIEQLGKVKYIFSDITDTLTKNEMVFKGCSIFTKLYDSSINEKDNNIKGSNYIPPPSEIKILLSINRRSVSKKNQKDAHMQKLLLQHIQPLLKMKN